MDRRPVILLLENEESDVFFFRRALSACRFEVDVKIVETVMQARDYLEGRGTFADQVYYQMPDLIVTDFKMNGHNGVEFIRWVKKHHNFKEIPVVMYSGSALPTDKIAAMESGALAFFHKSPDFREICESVLGILKFLPE